jgi:hypothetical protein
VTPQSRHRHIIPRWKIRASTNPLGFGQAALMIAVLRVPDAIYLLQILVSAFLAILFLQSGIDKIVDRFTVGLDFANSR